MNVKLVRPALFLLALGFLSTGCESIRYIGTRPKEPKNFSNPGEVGPQIRRVAMLPLYYEKEGEFLNDLDSIFRSEFSKTGLFEVVPINRTQLQTIFRRRQISSVEILPSDLLASMERDYGVHAILFTDITHYRPYTPISIGVRSKLVEVSTGEIRWAFDYTFDSGNPAVAAAARGYGKTNNRQEYPLDLDGGVLQSPSRFSKYVAQKTYGGLFKFKR